MLKLPEYMCHNAILRSYGQIFLQPSSRAGCLFILAIAVNALSQAFIALAAILTSLLTARLLKVSATDVSQGLYGFNAALLALAISNTLAITVTSLLLIIAGSALTALLLQQFQQRSTLPPFTAPYIVTGWVILLIAGGLQLSPPALPTGTEIDQFYTAVARGIGQVVFQDNALSGILCFAGLLCYSRPAAMWTLIASATGVFIAGILSFPGPLINNGSYSYNAVLTGIALGAYFPRRFILPLLGIGISVLLARGFQMAGIPVFTAPFVLASWLVIAFTSARKQGKS
ncbi:urea transporter [Aliamphritea hakodatensis]|uniref:urea transporter n=1 Tax=Aliamphritea hakodatensis TaxID=2895352 RepID=UPI0022FDAFBA|nr:urea transporter [Aliamphritea hakodatensis]